MTPVPPPAQDELTQWWLRRYWASQRTTLSLTLALRAALVLLLTFQGSAVSAGSGASPARWFSCVSCRSALLIQVLLKTSEYLSDLFCPS